MVKLCEPKLEVSDDVEHGNGSAIDRSRILNQPLKLQESTAKSDEVRISFSSFPPSFSLGLVS